MKPRHAAALALAGWYLMTPPIENEKVNPGAKFSTWGSYAKTERYEDCESLRQADFARFNKQSAKAAKLIADQMVFSACIATDDPRLKEK